MTDFEVGDTVQNIYWSEDRRVVLGVHEFTSPQVGTRLWLEKDGRDRGTVDSVSWAKVVPQFEVGKSYRHKADNRLVAVVSASPAYAVGWSDNGTLWTSVHRSLDLWEEVGVTINADLHRDLRVRGIVIPGGPE